MSGELLTQASVELDAIEKDFNRVKRLHAKGRVTDQKLDHVKAKYDASKAKVDMLLKNTEIRAPFSGIVTDFLLQEGENYFFSPNLKPGFSMTSGIVQLMKLNPVEVRFDVNEQDLQRIKEGQEVEIRLSAIADTVFKGYIDNIPDVLSTQTRSAKAVAQLANPRRLIKPGMSAQVDVLTKSEEAVFIPLEAIFRPQGTAESYVFILDGDVARRVKVKQIASIGNRVAVEGIKEQADVVVAGRNGLVSGDKVVVNNKQE
jgi:membrane fusion protein (multidrug efflux system)